MEILYVGGRHPETVGDVTARGATLRTAANVYDGIARLRRSEVGAAIVEFDALQPQPPAAMRELRGAANGRPVLVSMTPEEWDVARAQGYLDLDEVLLRPFYPDELWRRVTRAALPPPAQSTDGFRNDAERLGAFLEDAQRLNRFTADFHRLAEQCVAIVQSRLRAARVSLWVKGKDPGKFAAAHAAGLDREVRERETLQLGEGVAGSLAVRRRVALVEEAGRDGPAAGRPYRQPSYIIAPLVHDNDVLGVLCVTDRYEEGPFSPRDASYMEAFSQAAAQTVHNALQFRAADELATIDELTQLFNRRHFNRILPQEVDRARRYNHDLTLAMLDVDHFKQFNDANGHQAGDRALAHVARILKESFRKSDIVVRYGGEEFAVIMPETSRQERNGVGFVDRARQRVEEEGLAFEDREGRRRVLTMSGGVATFPLQSAGAEELLARADEALYRAKAAGRNRIAGA
ncbi:MAG: diguanylate cyclase [Planctomycetota bacterium]